MSLLSDAAIVASILSKSRAAQATMLSKLSCCSHLVSLILRDLDFSAQKKITDWARQIHTNYHPVILSSAFRERSSRRASPFVWMTKRMPVRPFASAEPVKQGCQPT